MKKIKFTGLNLFNILDWIDKDCPIKGGYRCEFNGDILAMETEHGRIEAQIGDTIIKSNKGIKIQKYYLTK